MFDLVAPDPPAGDQPQAIAKLSEGLLSGAAHQTLLGVTGSGKTLTIANVIAQVKKPTLVISHNKMLAARRSPPLRLLASLCRVDARSICCDAPAMKVQVNREAPGQFWRQRGMARLEIFGSALREDFREDSDVDLRCSLWPDVKCGLFEFAGHSERQYERTILEPGH